MNEFLQYLLNSAICLSTLYLLFRILMRKEAFFKLNRIVLLSIVICSLVIPKLIMPQFIQQSIQQPLEFQLPVFNEEVNNLLKIPVTHKTVMKAETNRSSYFSIQEIFVYSYLTGLVITFLILVYGLISIFILYRKAKVLRMDGYKMLVVEKEITAFSFVHLVFISQHDYKEHGQVILAHEKEHIRFGHFYDLFFLEVVKIIFWFNPFIYYLIHDLKDVHEFQADNKTLTKGIDATKYQLLIIQKSVGQQRFAFANSFNHCQIKNRIVMMNKQKTNKTRSWKAVTFLPVLALLLLTFCKPDYKILGTWQLVSYKYGEGKETTVPDNLRAIKFITPNHFNWINYKTENNLVCESAGGSYVFDGENYTENVEYGGNSMVPNSMVPGKSKFKIKIKGDQMFLSGSLSDGLKREEVWKKLQ